MAKKFTPPSDAVETTTQPESTWTPPSDAVVTEPVKKKESTVQPPSSADSFVPSPHLSSKDTEPSSESSKEKPKSARKKYQERAGDLTKTMQSQLDDFTKTKKKEFNKSYKDQLKKEVDKKRDELDVQLENKGLTPGSPEYVTQVNKYEKQIADFSNQRSKELFDENNEKFKSELEKKTQEIRDTHSKFGDIYADIYRDEAVGEAKALRQADLVVNMDNPAEALWNTIRSGIVDQLPQEYSVQRLRMSKGNFGDLFDRRSDINAFGDQLPKYVSRGEFVTWNLRQPEGVQNKSYDERARIFLTEKLGPEGFEELKQKFTEDNLKQRVGFERDIQAQKTEAQDKLKYVVQDLEQVDGAMSFLNFAGNMVGQALYRAPTSILSGGVGSIVSESAAVYDRQVDLIAEKNGITREEVIKQGLDEPAEGQALAVLAGELDAVSSLNIVGLFRKSAARELTKGTVKKFTEGFVKGAVPEAITETTQGELEELGASIGANVEYKPDAWRMATGAVGGVIGGGILSSVTTFIPERVPEAIKPIEELVTEISKANLSPEVAAKNIEEIVNETLKQDVQRPTDSSGFQQGSEVAIDPKTISTQTEESQQESREEIPQVDGRSELETLREQILTSPEDVKIDGRKVTMITEKGADMVRRYVELKEKQNETPSDAQASTQPGGAVEQQRAPSEPDATETESVGVQEGQQPAPEVTGDTRSAAQEPPRVPPADEQKNVQAEQPKDTRTLKIAKRIMDSDANEAIKKGVKDKGADYVPKKIEVTDKEAKDLIELYGDDKAEAIVRDTKNDITPDTRIALSARLYESIKNQGDKATDPQQKAALYDKAVDVGLFAAEYAKELGRGVNAAKIMKAITADEDLAVMAFEKANKATAKKLVAPIEKQVTQTKEQIDAEIRRLVEAKVQETVATRLQRAKLITTEQKKKISDAFDSLKVKTDDTANDITRVLGAAVWNGSLEAMKKAILTGADVANAVQSGLDYIRSNFKGDFSEDEFRNMVTPAITPLVEKQKVDVADIDETKVKTKGLSAKKKKELITQSVEEYNKKGEISDERFEELYAKQIGYREYTPQERDQIRQLAKVIAEAEKFTEDIKENFSRDKIAKYEDLMKKAQKANQDLQLFAREPSSLTDTLISIMQGNLLTLSSIVTNIYSNVALQPLRFTSSAVGSLVERGVNTVAKLGLLDRAYKDPTIDLLAVQQGFAQGAWNGTMEGVYQLKSGTLTDEKALRDIQSSFNPVRAIARWAEADRNTKQKINDYIEGTLGWPAEAMFRLLNFGDKPFRRAAELGRAMEIADRKQLKGDDRLKFLMFPDDASALEIEKAGKEATFQQDGNVITKKIQDVISDFLTAASSVPYVGGLFKLILKSQIPFVKTPLNIIGETLDYGLPPLTIARGIWEVRSGNARSGYVRIGKGLVGLMIMAAARQLFQIGLLSWEDDDDKKGRNIQYDTVPPASLNVSALQRGLLGEGFEAQDDDVWVNYKKLGIVGILFDNYTSLLKNKTEEDGEMPGFAEQMVLNPVTIVKATFEQSFLKGVNSLLNAIQDGGGYKTQNWAVETVGAISSIAIPNTIATVSKSSDEFIRDTYNRDIVERLKSTYMSKLFLGDQLPPKVNLWGEKVTGNPEGRDKFLYYLFDPTKFKEVDTDSYKYKLYESWKEDNFNNDWLPSLPKRSVSVKGINMQLTPEEYEKFATYVGEMRANSTSAYINSSFRFHDKEQRVKKLKKYYEEGMKMGKKKFLMEMGWNVKTKEALEEINKKR